MTVTTQAPNPDRRPPREKASGHIKKLSFDLSHHGTGHTLAEVFDPYCAECIYWAAKIVQNPQYWSDAYRVQQVDNLAPLPLDVINHAIRAINDRGYALKIKAREFGVDEFAEALSL